MKDILFIIGSESDRKNIESGIELIREKGLSHELVVYSAHRNLPELMAFLEKEDKNYRIIITAAGLSAALPGGVALLSKKPLIGITFVSGPLYNLPMSKRNTCRNKGDWKAGSAQRGTSGRKNYKILHLILLRRLQVTARVVLLSP